MIIPIGHEHLQAQRLPYITIGIVVLNVLLFLITLSVGPDSQEQRVRSETELVNYFMAYSYLEFPDRVVPKLMPYNQRLLKTVGSDDISPQDLKDAGEQAAISIITRQLQSAFPTTPTDEEEQDEDAIALMQQQQQQQLDELVETFETCHDNDFYLKYGYIPARGGFFTMFSSIFLHGGFFHLLFNMLFLWLSGANIEDLWGRIVFPIFYLLGGALATLAHGWMFPTSTIPLIGASGAIAALMGAFMIRMYNTKIYFIYFFGFRMHGRFSAPAYVMLPLWLLQQIGNAMMSVEGAGVAFWAHIGGFVFGVVVALVIKASGFEEKVLAPAIEKKVTLVDEHLASGIEKLQEQDFDGAIQELKTFLKDNPNDVMAHSELSKAYFANDKTKLALREFKRALFLQMKHGNLDDAIDYYLELSAELPDVMLDPPQQKKIADAIEQRAAHEAEHPKPTKKGEPPQALVMYTHAAQAYKKLLNYYQQKKTPVNNPDVIHALLHYGDLCLCYLEQPQNALQAYQILVNVPDLDPELKEKTEARIQQATTLVKEQEQVKKLLQKKKKAAKAHKAEASNKAPAKKIMPNIPIPKRLKMVPEDDAPPRYKVPSLDPIVANKVFPAEGGLDLKRQTDPPILFDQISVICVFQLQESEQKLASSAKAKKKKGLSSFSDTQEVIYADLFVAGQSRPYRIASNRIAFTKFFQKYHQSSLENFRQFIVYIISNLYSVYIDQATLKYLKIGKPKIYSDRMGLRIHEKIFWKQLLGMVWIPCEHCHEVYWMNGAKIPKQGAQAPCAKCGKPITVKPLTIPHQA